MSEIFLTRKMISDGMKDPLLMCLQLPYSCMFNAITKVNLNSRFDTSMSYWTRVHHWNIIYIDSINLFPTDKTNVKYYKNEDAKFEFVSQYFDFIRILLL